jgi:hypothetical protein
MRKHIFKAGGILLGILLAWMAAAPAHLLTEGYTQTDRMVVADAQQIKSTGVTFIDAPWSTWTVGNTRYWITSDWWGDNISMYSGPADDPTKNIIYSKDRSELYTNNDEINGQPWIVSVYKISDTELLAFLHMERVATDAVPNPTKTTGSGAGRLSLAYSDNNAETFEYLGEIVAPHEDKVDANIQGTPYLIRDGYFYIYFNEINTNVARARVADVVAAARNKQVTDWKKYYEGNWDEPGMGGLVSMTGLPGISHTQAAYSTYDGKYYMIMTSMNWGGADTYVKLWQSDDCVNWRFYQVVVEEPASYYSASSGWQYASIVDYGNEQNATVGQKFYVYCGNKTSDVDNMNMVRWTVDLADAPIKSTPISVWHFNEDPSDANEQAIGIGNAVRLLGLNNYIKIYNHHSMNQLNQITLSTWVNLSGFPVQNTAPVAKDWSFRFIIHKDGNGHFVVATENDEWYGSGTTANFAGPLEIGKWAHLVGTYDGQSVKVYLNGQLQGTGANTISGKVASSNNPLRIGYGSGSVDYFYGMVDETKLYNKALSATEVLSLYQSDLQKAEESSSVSDSSESSSVALSSTISSSALISSGASSSSTASSSLVPQSDASSDSLFVSDTESGSDFSQTSGEDPSGDSESNLSQESSESSDSSASSGDDSGGNTVLWVTVLILALAGAGIGGYFLYRRFRQPV